MKAHIASLINAVTLISMGAWGYLESVQPAFSKFSTALIPVIIGALLLVFFKGIKKEDKVISHIVVLLTFIMLIGLIKPLTAGISQSAPLKIFRVSLMIFTSLLAIISFVRSFKEARKNKS